MIKIGKPYVDFDENHAYLRGKVEIDGKEEHEHEHHYHTTLQDIEHKVSQLNLPEKVRKNDKGKNCRKGLLY